VILKPAAHLDQLDEVLVITSTEPRFPQDQQQDMAASEALKGAEAEKQKTSEGMAEKLPGLIDPKLPADQQPLNDTSNPNPVSRPPVAIHPDRFTPGNGATPSSPAATQGSPAANPAKKKPSKPESSQPATNPASTPSASPQGENR